MSLVGTWKLVSHEIVSVASKKGGRKVAYPFGKKPLGLLVYTPRGHMSVAIASEKRKKFKKGAMKSTAKERAAAMETFLSYAGKYRIEGKEVVHDVEVCSIQDWAGAEIRREVTLKGNLLVLSVPPFVMGSKKQVAHFTWKRVEL